MVCQEFFLLDVLVREDLSHYIVVVLIGFEALFFSPKAKIFRLLRERFFVSKSKEILCAEFNESKLNVSCLSTFQSRSSIFFGSFLFF